MGRKRKTVTSSTVVDQDLNHNACPRVKSAQEKEELHLHNGNSNAMETMSIENNVQPNPVSSPTKNKKSRSINEVVRRSGRLKSSRLPFGTRQVKPVVEHIDLVENEKQESPHCHQVSTLQVLKKKNSEVEAEVQKVMTMPEVNQRSLEEKVDYLVETIDDFKSKVVETSHGDHSPNLSYKSLYFDSQKKIEALLEANYELVRKLEFAHGKVEAYEKMNVALGAPRAATTLDAADNPKKTKKTTYKKRKTKA